MLRGRRKVHHEINAGSMADIAFLMLVFFLLTSTLDRNYAFNRTLPAEDKKEQPQEANKRNILSLSLNATGDLAINGKTSEVGALKDAIKTFILNPANDASLSEKVEKPVKQLGKVPVSAGVVEIKTDDNTTYAAYIRVNDQVNKAFAEMKDQFALKRFGAAYGLLDDFRRQIVDECVPVSISE